MRVFDISFLGWIHTLACLIALAAGPLVFAMRKGTLKHRKIGYLYVGSMAAANLTALGLFAPIPGLPAFNMFHWMAIGTLVMLALGVWAVRNRRTWLGAYGHPVMMVLSFYMLIGGAINEAFARIGALRAAAVAGSPWAHNVSQTRLFGTAQGAAMLAAVLLIVWFAVETARMRSRQKRVHLVPAE